MESVGEGRTTIVTSSREGTAPVLTFFENYGSGASEIAPKVAERLGVPFRQQAFTSEQIAAAPDEALQTPGAWDRFVRGFSFTDTQHVDLHVRPRSRPPRRHLPKQVPGA